MKLRPAFARLMNPAALIVLCSVLLAHPTHAQQASGTLVVTITFDGAGAWKHAKNGAYSNLKFHRALTYTVPLRGMYGANRALVLQPRDAIGPAGRACGKGKSEFLDESSGMQRGDPGQPALVPFTEIIKGGGPFPSGDRTVPERDLCLTKVSVDFDKHVFHMSLDGTDSNVKVQVTRNGFKPPPMNLPLQGYDNGSAKAKLTWSDVPLPASASGDKAFEGMRTIESFNTVSGPMDSTFPLRATVNYRVSWQ